MTNMIAICAINNVYVVSTENDKIGYTYMRLYMYISSLCFSHTIPPSNYSMQFIYSRQVYNRIGKYSKPKSLSNN